MDRPQDFGAAEPLVSIVVPIYNEAGILRKNTQRLRGYLNEMLPSHEIVLCENGSVDGTAEIASGLSEEFDDIEFLGLPEPCLGEALKAGFRAARADKVVYFPIDLSANLSFIPWSVNLLDVFDVVVGSKRLNSELDHRPFIRRAVSRAYHGMVKGFYGLNFTDTTCVKAYRRNTILDLMDRIPTSSGIYETELLAEALREGLEIVEVPVAVEERRASREVLGSKIIRKLEDLLSARLKSITIVVGTPFFIGGLLSLLNLTIGKLRSGATGGFVNPYSFLLSMLSVFFGFQILAFGLLTNLVMQIRRQISKPSEQRA